MKIGSSQFALSIAAAALTLSSVGTSAFAAAPSTLADASLQAPAFVPMAWEQMKIDKLTHAYALLENSNADYNGHKLEAMRSIKRAAAILGVELHGKPKLEERQWKSDRSVAAARGLLQDLQDSSHGGEQQHIHKAVTELDKALAIK